MEKTHSGRTYELRARHDGDFWYVGIHDADGRELYEYQLNAPKTEEAACERAWEIYLERHLAKQ